MKQRGFTLIELIIVILTLGILTFVSLPAYQDYMAKGRATAAFHEISTGKSSYEIIVNHGYRTISTASDIGLPSDTDFCQISVNNPDNTGTATKAISCTLKNTIGFSSNAEIYISRSANGIYSCDTIGFPEKYKPNSCS